MLCHCLALSFVESGDLSQSKQMSSAELIESVKNLDKATHALSKNNKPDVFINKNITEVYTYSSATSFQIHKGTSNYQSDPTQSFRLIIANGGGGQVGIISYLARQFFLSSTPELNGAIGWHTSNTQYSHQALRDGVADISIVYDKARIKEALVNGEIYKPVGIVHCWMDRFCIIGPEDCDINHSSKESVSDFLLELLKVPGAYFLTRVDASTAHHRESKMIANVVNKIRGSLKLDILKETDLLELLSFQGWKSMSAELQQISNVSFTHSQVIKNEILIKKDKMNVNFEEYIQLVRPDFYRPFYLLPQQAAIMCQTLGYFTLSDIGIFKSTFLVTNECNRAMKIHLVKGTKKDEDFFKNPAYAIMSSKALHFKEALMFMKYLKNDDQSGPGLRIESFKCKDGSSYYESPYECVQNEIFEFINPA